MSEFLASLKADLTSRRLAPLLIVAIVGLAGALFYALHVSAHSTPAATAVVASPSGSSSLTVTRASNAADQALAETANGTSYQHDGQAHDPFTPLAPSSSTTTSTATSSSTTPSSTTTPSATSTATGQTVAPSSHTDTGGSGSRGSSATPERSDLAGQSTTVYSVSIEQQSLTAGLGATPATTTTTPTTTTTTSTTTTTTTAPAAQPSPTSLPLSILRGVILPSPQAPMLVYEGVLAGGHYAIFRIIGEVLPADGGYCLPSPVSCEALKLASGQSERLRYGYDGATVESTLEVTAIKATKETKAVAVAFDRLYAIQGKSKLGSTFAGGLRYSPRRGVLVGPHA